MALLGAVVLSAFLLAGPVGGTGGGSPLAEAGLDQQVRLGETVRLDATGSYDPDGSVVAYEWQVRTPSGRTVSPLDPHAARTTFPATATGRYEVSLTVTDDDGNTGTDTMYVLVGAGAEGRSGVPPSGVNDSNARLGSVPSIPSPDGSVGSSAGCSTDGSTGEGGIDGGCSSAERPPAFPRVSIEGPMVVKAEQTHTYAAVARGLGDDRTYGWDAGGRGRSHTLRFRSGGLYTVWVGVEDARGRSATARLEVFVAPVENALPEVEIADPEAVSAGQRVALSVDARDPDGRIVSTEWSPDRHVEVPTDGSSRTVRVTVTDDDGASVTDSITVSGNAWNGTIVATDTTDVTCYVTNMRQRDGRNPYSDRCIWENGGTVSQTTGPDDIESLRRNEKIDLHWRRISRERLAELDAGDTSIDYGVAVKSPHDEADVYGQSDDPVRMWTTGRWSDVDNDESFTLQGKTVEDDIDGDGEVNAADWDQQYRTRDDTANVDRHADATAAFKRSIRDGPTGERDEGGALADARRASARTITGSFAGTSIDAETRRDSIAALSHRTRTVRSSGDSGDSSGSDAAAADDRTDRDDSNDSNRSTDSGDTDGTDSGDGEDGTDREDTDSGSEGASRHSPHGGRIVTFP